jgi:hypothetical protein
VTGSGTARILPPPGRCTWRYTTLSGHHEDVARERWPLFVRHMRRILRVSRERVALVSGAEAARKRRDERRLAVLKRYVPSNAIGAEIGVHKGRFTRELLDGLSPAQLHAIDPWYLLGAEWTWDSGDPSTSNALAAIIRRCADELVSRRLVLHVGFDLEVMKGLADGSFDWVYLDSSHQYQHTVAELDLLCSKVKPGGFITGDDWQSAVTHKHHGVCRAVREFVEARRFELLYASDEDDQWVARLPEMRPNR